MALTDDPQPIPLDSSRFLAREPLWHGHHCDSWLGYDRTLDRSVVVKVAHAGDAAAVNRLAHELEIHRTLTHPTLVGLLEADLSCATPYLVLERVPASMSSAAGRAMDAQLLRTVLVDLLEAAVQLDAVGLRHDHLIPQHVLLDWGGRARLCGLGHTVRIAAGLSDEAGNPVEATLSQRMSRSESVFAIAYSIVGVALGDCAWQPDPALPARRVIAEIRPDLLSDDPVLVGALDAMLHPEPTLRLDLEQARDTLLRPVPMLVR